MHADRPGERPRLLYWYRTAPGIVLGRSPLDEDAIRTIEEQHPDIEFDWPAILALSEVMTPEDEAPARPAQQQRQGRRQRNRDSGREQSREPRRDQRARDVEESTGPAGSPVEDEAEAASGVDAAIDVAPVVPMRDEESDFDAPEEEVARPTTHGLLESLVGREIATRLRARYSEITARIHERDVDGALREAWLKRAEPLNPDLWLTADAVLEGVRGADGLFERLRAELVGRP
jgi:hypothetical protein